MRIENAVGKVESGKVVSSGDVLTDVLVEKLEHERYTVGKDEMLTHVLKLVDVVHLKVLQEEEESGGNGLDDDLLVSVDVNRYLSGLDDVSWSFGRQNIDEDIEGVIP